MSTDKPEQVAARVEAERARAKLMGTAHELQTRLSPGTIANNAWTGAKTRSADLAEEAVDVVRTRPAMAGGVAAAVGLFLVRNPLLRLFKRKPRLPKATRKHLETTR
jgi:ElaB/YqjD/DUF883 family membrane-anchored ribosome-binding protein